MEALTRHPRQQRFIAPLGVGARLQSGGVPAEKITELGRDEIIGINGVKYAAEPALHLSAHWTHDRNKTLQASCARAGAGRYLYWSGDSGYGKPFAAIGEKNGGFDIAFIEIDAATLRTPAGETLTCSRIRPCRARSTSTPASWFPSIGAYSIWEERPGSSLSIASIKSWRKERFASTYREWTKNIRRKSGEPINGGKA